MKKLTFLLTVALMAIATTASAQFVSGGKKSGGAAIATENYNAVWVGYSPVSVGKMDMTGISAGWTKGISLMDDKPLFLETGVNVMYGFGDKEEVDYSYLGVNIPVLATWKFAVSEKVTLAPFAGLNLRGNLLGKMKSDYFEDDIDWFDSVDEGGLDAKRFCVGASFGVNVDIDKWMVGVGYTTDFTEIADHTDIDYFTISVGLKF